LYLEACRFEADGRNQSVKVGALSGRGFLKGFLSYISADKFNNTTYTQYLHLHHLSGECRIKLVDD
jgi:hypothetical protein